MMKEHWHKQKSDRKYTYHQNQFISVPNMAVSRSTEFMEDAAHLWWSGQAEAECPNTPRHEIWHELLPGAMNWSVWSDWEYIL